MASNIAPPIGIKQAEKSIKIIDFHNFCKHARLQGIKCFALVLALNIGFAAQAYGESDFGVSALHALSMFYESCHFKAIEKPKVLLAKTANG